MFSTFARGKLLITGEYAVLDGAQALAVPVRYGQSFVVSAGKSPGELTWESVDCEGNTWFSARFNTKDLSVVETSDMAVASRLQGILQQCNIKNQDLAITIVADFPLNWGLGSSSTLIAAIARWNGADPYRLLAATFGGSGYDIACAYADGPLVYQLDPSLPPGQRETVTAVHFDPLFKDELYFIYLGKKQDSREGIRRYREKIAGKDTGLVAEISNLTKDALKSTDLASFEKALLAHEHLLASALELPRAQELYFPEFPGVIKSLGAWGGDFVLATLPGNDTMELDKLWERGYLVFGYSEMVSNIG